MVSLVDHLGRERPRPSLACLTTVGHDAESFARDGRVEMRVLAPHGLVAIARRRPAKSPLILVGQLWSQIGFIDTMGRVI